MATLPESHLSQTPQKRRNSPFCGSAFASSREGVTRRESSGSGAWESGAVSLARPFGCPSTLRHQHPHTGVLAPARRSRSVEVH